MMLNRRIFLLLSVLMTMAACGGDKAPATNGKVILVTGATGTQGGAVARELITRGYAVRGLTRNPDSDRAKALSDEGAEMVKGDFDDAASLAAAMQGAHGVFAVTNFWEHGYDKEVAHGKQLVDAAKTAGVSHFIFTSVASADVYTGIPHFESKGEIEVYLAESGIIYSVVRPVSFMDNVLFARSELLKGVYYDPRDTGKKHQWIAASDIGFFVGEALDNPDEWNGKALDIAGDEMTLAEYVDELSYSIGLDIHHQQISWESFENQAGEEMTLMTRWFDEKGYGIDVAALREQYPNLKTYREFLREIDWQN